MAVEMAPATIPKIMDAGTTAADMEKITEPIELEFGLYPCFTRSILPLDI